MRGTWQTDDHRTVGGALVLAVIGAVILLGSGAAAKIATAVVVVLIAIAVVAVLAVGGLGAYLVYRARQDRPGRPVGAPMAYQLPPEVRPQLEESHIHVDPEQLAAIINRIGHEE